MQKLNNQQLITTLKRAIFKTESIYRGWEYFNFSSLSDHLEDFGLLQKSDWVKFPASTYTHEPEEILDIFIQNHSFLQQGNLIVETDGFFFEIVANTLVHLIFEEIPKLSQHKSCFMDGKTDYVFINIEQKKALFLYCHELYYAVVDWAQIDLQSDRAQVILNNEKETPLPNRPLKVNYKVKKVNNRYNETEEHRVLPKQQIQCEFCLDPYKYPVRECSYQTSEALLDKFYEYEKNYHLELLDAFEDIQKSFFRFEAKDKLNRLMRLEFAPQGHKVGNFIDPPHIALYFQNKTVHTPSKTKWQLLHKYY